ncbi:MAG: hypothetical protein WC627_09665 [Legionella sp.]|jgi:hypothetical protein
MVYTKIKDLLDAETPMDEGFVYLQKHPLEFLELVKKNHLLALKYAQNFTTVQLETMISNAYGVFDNNKFFTLLINLDPTKVQFHDAVSQSQMLNYFLERNLTYIDVRRHKTGYKTHISTTGHYHHYVFFFQDPTCQHPILWGQQTENITAKSFVYGEFLEYKYRELTQNKDIINCIFNIAASLLNHVQTEKILDSEFKNEEAWTFNRPRTNTMFPKLMSYPSHQMGQILASMLTFTSPEIAQRELAAASPTAGFYFKQIISHYPLTKPAYEAALMCFHKAAMNGRSSFREYLDKFNFDILIMLEQKEYESEHYEGIADAFFEIGNLCIKDATYKNPILEKYSKTGAKYVIPKEQRAKVERKWSLDSSASSSSSSSNLSSNSHSFFKEKPNSQPPAYQPSAPPFNPYENTNNN